MCKTKDILQSIANVEAKQKRVNPQRMAQVNDALDEVYNILYDQFDSISVSDYNQFSDALQQMQDAMAKETTSPMSALQTERLQSSLSAIQELKNDLVSYRLQAPSPQMTQLLASAGRLMA